MAGEFNFGEIFAQAFQNQLALDRAKADREAEINYRNEQLKLSREQITNEKDYQDKILAMTEKRDAFEEEKYLTGLRKGYTLVTPELREEFGKKGFKHMLLGKQIESLLHNSNIYDSEGEKNYYYDPAEYADYLDYLTKKQTADANSALANAQMREIEKDLNTNFVVDPQNKIVNIFTKPLSSWQMDEYSKSGYKIIPQKLYSSTLGHTNYESELWRKLTEAENEIDKIENSWTFSHWGEDAYFAFHPSEKKKYYAMKSAARNLRQKLNPLENKRKNFKSLRLPENTYNY